MKRIIALIFVTLIASQVGAIDLGKKLALRLVNFPLNPAMDTGVYNAIKWPDSATIAVWATTGADTGAATSQVIYGTSTTTVTAAGLAALGIRADTVGAPMFVFCDTARIINAGTTTRQIAGVVTLWRLGAPFQTQFSMEIYADTLLDEVKTVSGTSQTAKDLGATTQIILDTLQVYDNATRFQADVQEILDTLQTYDAAGRFQADAQEILDTLQVYDNATRFQADVQEILDTLQTYDAAGRFQADAQEILDSIQLYDNWVRDSIHNAVIYARTAADSIQVYDNAGRFQADIQEVLDTLQAYDNATRFQLVVQELLDTLKTYDNTGRFQLVVQEILDTLKTYDNAGRFQADAQEILDTLQLYDGRWALASELQKAIDTINAISDTLQNVNSSLRVDTNTTWTTAQRDTLLNRSLVTKDSTYAVLDTLQNGSSTLRIATVDTAAVARSVWDNDVVAQVNRTVTATVTVDTAAVARSVWDNDVIARANRTVDEIDTAYFNVGCDTTPAGDFLLTLGNYRDQIKRKMGVATTNTTWMADTTLNEIIREAIVTVNPIMRGYKTTKVMVSHFDSSDYPLDSLVGISAVLWHKNDTARSIPYLAREKWATLATQTTWGGDDPYLERPQVYDYTDNEISFFPVPTSEDTIKIYGWSKIPNITVVSSVAQIPQKYRIAVLKYATFLVARAKQHPMLQTYLDEYHESLGFLLGVQKEEDAKK